MAHRHGLLAPSRPAGSRRIRRHLRVCGHCRAGTAEATTAEPGTAEATTAEPGTAEADSGSDAGVGIGTGTGSDAGVGTGTGFGSDAGVGTGTGSVGRRRRYWNRLRP